MAWHHAECLREHGACATCGSALAEEGDPELAGAYQQLFGVLSGVLVAIGLAAGGLLGWWTQSSRLAGILTLLGAVVGLLLSHLLSARFLGTDRHGELTATREEAPPAPRWWRLIRGLPSSFIFGWSNLGVLGGALLGLYLTRSALGVLIGIALGGACGASAHLALTWRELQAESLSLTSPEEGRPLKEHQEEPAS